MSINPSNLENNNMPSYCYKQQGKKKNTKTLSSKRSFKGEKTEML